MNQITIISSVIFFCLILCSSLKLKQEQEIVDVEVKDENFKIPVDDRLLGFLQSKNHEFQLLMPNGDLSRVKVEDISEADAISERLFDNNSKTKCGYISISFDYGCYNIKMQKVNWDDKKKQWVANCDFAWKEGVSKSKFTFENVGVKDKCILKLD